VTSVCEVSALTIPARSSYVQVASAYVQAVACHFGFSDEQSRQLAEALGLILKDLMVHAFEPNNSQEVHISCEYLPVGLKAVIKEQGLPLAQEELPSLDASRRSAFPKRLGDQLACVQDVWDEASFQNKGPAGAAVQLVKYFSGCGVEPATGLYLVSPDATPVPGPGEPETFQVRPFTPADAQAVVRLFYLTYGYSYPHEYLYYPERLIALNATGSLRSLVAVSPQGELAGHVALFFSPDHPNLAEIGAGVVNPDFRGHRCLQQLTEQALAEAQQCHIQALFGQLVTNHTYSQKVAETFDFKPCGLLVGCGSASLSFKKIHEDLSQRESLILMYRGIRPISPVSIYLPTQHTEWISRLYAWLGMNPLILSPPGDLKATLPLQGHLELITYPDSGIAVIKVGAIGRETPDDIRHTLKHLCQARFDVIQLQMDLGQPAVPELAVHSETLGFFLAGLLPGLNGAQTLILQYLNNVPIDYDQIRLDSLQAQEVLAYVKGLDPNLL
jgi:serine/threonine-protein kinase RsbW